MKTAEYGAYLIRDVIVKYIDDNGYPPTIQEIAGVMGYSISGIYPMIKEANNMGLITSGKGARKIKVHGYKFVKVGEA